MAGKTEGWSRGITRLSIRPSWTALSPASTLAWTDATSPATTTRYLPEQMVRASRSSTSAAFSMASSAAKPRPMLDTSRSPMVSGRAVRALSPIPRSPMPR